MTCCFLAGSFACLNCSNRSINVSPFTWYYYPTDRFQLDTTYTPIKTHTKIRTEVTENTGINKVTRIFENDILAKETIEYFDKNGKVIKTETTTYKENK